MKSDYDTMYFLHLEEIKRKDVGDIMCATLDEIKGLSAEEILGRTGQKREVPVKLDVVMDKLGVKWFPTSFKELEEKEKKKILGLVLLNGDDVGIFYWENAELFQKRFVIAHELGHCCLHADKLKDGYIDYYSEESEKEDYEKGATAFAMRLLMPEEGLRNIVSKMLKPSLKTLSEIFQVPEKTMKERLEDLHIAYYTEEGEICGSYPR